MDNKSLWKRPTGSGGHYFETPADLDAAMKGDPFYNPDVPLSGVIFTNIAPKPDPFEQAEAENPGADFRRFIQETENEKLAQAHTFYAGEWRVQIRYKAGKWICNASNQDSGETKSFTLANVGSDRDSAMSSAGAYLRKFAPPWQQLTPAQLTEISRIASGGGPSLETALYRYLKYAIPNLDRDVTNDPVYQPLCDEVCWFVFRHGYIDVTDEAAEWMQTQLGERAVTINSLYAARELWQAHKIKRDKGRLFAGTALAEQAEPTAEQITEQLDSLSDESLEALRVRTAQLNARRK
jgi:hypothetical protein